MWKNLGIILAFELTLFSVFLLSFTATVDEPADFAFVNSTEPQTLDPCKMTGQPEGRIAQAIFEGLVVYHPKTLEPLPGVAKSWDISPDGLTYTFHLRDDSWWVRGEEKVRTVTAEDFVYSWQRVLNSENASQYTYILYFIAGAEDYYQSEKDALKKALIAWEDKHPDQVPKSVVDMALGEAPAERPVIGLGDLPAADRERLLAARDARFRKTVGLKAVDDLTLRITLKSPAPFFLGLTSFYPLYPVNKECLEENQKWTRPGTIVTNGPFLLDSWKFNDRIRLRRNPNYWDVKNVGMETIDALAVEEYTTGLNLYLKRQVDWIPQLPNPMLPALGRRNVPGGENDYHNFASQTVYFYRVNVDREPFKGEKGKLVRQALALAIDRKSLIDNVAKARQKPAWAIVPPGMPGFTGARGLDQGSQEANIKLAQEKLAAAGYPNGKGFPTKFLLYNTSDTHKQIAVTIQEFWKKNLNIDVELQNQEWGTYLDTVHKIGFDMARAGWIGDYPDPNTFLDMWVTGGPQNNTNWSNERFDRLIAASGDMTKALGDPKLRATLLADAPELAADMKAWQATPDPARKRALNAGMRLRIFEICDAIIADELPIIPIYFYTMNEMWPQELLGMHENLRDTHMLKFLRWKDGYVPPRLRRED